MASEVFGDRADANEYGWNAVKGWGNIQSDLDFQADFNPGALALDAFGPGRICTLDANGQFQMGGSGSAMPMYLMSGTQMPSVSRTGVSTKTGKPLGGGRQYGMGKGSALVATGGYEVQTFDFKGDDNYAPNDYVTSDAEGVVRAEVDANSWICGQCSWSQGEEVDSLQPAPAPVDGPVGEDAFGTPTLTYWLVRGRQS